MMIALACVVGYIAMILGFCLWDAYIGTGVNWDGYYNDVPLPLAAIFWWIAIPIIALMRFVDLTKGIKATRELKKKLAEKQRNNIRIAAEKEEQEILEQVENELNKESLPEYKDTMRGSSPPYW